MIIKIGEIAIDADCEDALNIAHDIDALVNEQGEWERNDCDGPTWRLS